jgi:hypothetical protein
VAQEVCQVRDIRRVPHGSRGRAYSIVLKLARAPKGGMAMESTTARAQTSRSIGKGVLAGIVAGIAMAMYAMIAAATYQGHWLFHPPVSHCLHVH